MRGLTPSSLGCAILSVLQLAASQGADGKADRVAAPNVIGMQPIHGELLEDCGSGITQCGRIASVKTEFVYASTSYVTSLHTFEDVTTLSTETATVTSIVRETIITGTQGQCRNTTTVVLGTPLIIRVDVNTTTTREFVPIVTSTKTQTITVAEGTISQCLIKGSVFPTLFPEPTAGPSNSTSVIPTSTIPPGSSNTTVSGSGAPTILTPPADNDDEKAEPIGSDDRDEL